MSFDLIMLVLIVSVSIVAILYICLVGLDKLPVNLFRARTGRAVAALPLARAIVVRDDLAKPKPAQMRSRRELRELRSRREPGAFPDLCRDIACCPWPND